MHQSAISYAKKFFETYCSGELADDFKIIEIGSQDVNGSLRDVAPHAAKYIGLDFVSGKGVDIVIDDPYKIPLLDKSADIVVTSSCFEHSEFFWLTFNEMARIIKPGGFIYINVPSNGMYHKYPVDCWRFYPDSGQALAAWARRSGHEIELIESFIGKRSDEDIWNDFVAVFRKNNNLNINCEQLISDCVDGVTNVHARSNFSNHSEFGYEYKKIKELTINSQVNDENNSQLLRSIDGLNKDVKVLRDKIKIDEIQFEKFNRLIEEKDKYIQNVVNSLSWKVTFPARVLGNMIRKSIFFYILNYLKLFLALPKVISYYQGSVLTLIPRVIRLFKREGYEGLIRRVNIILGNNSVIRKFPVDVVEYDADFLEDNQTFNPLVSVIVPNYNHDKYLRKRLDSIYGQTYKNIEIILLDDFSTDSSAGILKEYASKYSDNTKLIINEKNSGGVFLQWKKGLEVASGKLVWIAESDDFCSDNFLDEQVKSFRNPAVMLSFCNTKFIEGEQESVVWTLEQYLLELGIADWNKKFVRSAHSIVNEGWAVKNILPNVSGAIFKHPGKMPLLNDSDWLNLKLCGDWVFYLTIIRGGLVAYTPSAINYYRQHNDNTSKNIQKNNLYYAEFEVVASYLVKLYKLSRNVLVRQEEILYRHWSERKGGDLYDEFKSLYDIDRIYSTAPIRKPNIMMAVYAMIAGGGETFPILLANLLYKNGYSVTLLNCMEKPNELGVLNMLDPMIPRIDLNKINTLGIIASDMGAEIIHSHHAWVDTTLASLLVPYPEIKQVVSMHGMYEMMSTKQFECLRPLLSQRISQFVYTAEKNIESLPQSFIEQKKFTKINNALPAKYVNPVDLSCLNIGGDDFVLCMVSRAIPEKGWSEAINAIKYCNERSSRRVHILIIGEGPEYDALHILENSPYIHFLGFKENIRDYFASCNFGFLPSRFKGESAPLVVIDCLLSGKPVLASDIGEIRKMIDSENGLAGDVFPLENWRLDSELIADYILKYVNNESLYNEVKSKVGLAVLKFSTEAMVEKYEKVYSDCWINKTE